MNLNEPATNSAPTPLTEQAKEARRAYQRQWRKRNPEKVKAIQQRHWEKKAAEMAATVEKEGEE